jgi:hypothetical protein
LQEKQIEKLKGFSQSGWGDFQAFAVFGNGAARAFNALLFEHL